MNFKRKANPTFINNFLRQNFAGILCRAFGSGGRSRSCRLPSARKSLAICIIYMAIITSIIYFYTLLYSNSKKQQQQQGSRRESEILHSMYATRQNLPVSWGNSSSLIDFFHAELNQLSKPLQTYGADSVCNSILETTYLNGRLKVFCVQPKSLDQNEPGYRVWCYCNPYDHTSMCRCRVRNVMLYLHNLFQQLHERSLVPTISSGGSAASLPYAYSVEPSPIRCFPLSVLDVDVGHGFSRMFISDFTDHATQPQQEGSPETFAHDQEFLHATCNSTSAVSYSRRPVALLLQEPTFAARDAVASLCAALTLFMTLRDVLYMDAELATSMTASRSMPRSMKPMLIIQGESSSNSSKEQQHRSLFAEFIQLLEFDFDVIYSTNTSTWTTTKPCMLIDNLILVPSYLNGGLYRCLKPYPSVLLAEQCRVCNAFALPSSQKNAPILSSYERQAGEGTANNGGFGNAAAKAVAGFGMMVRNLLSPGEDSAAVPPALPPPPFAPAALDAAAVKDAKPFMLIDKPPSSNENAPPPLPSPQKLSPWVQQRMQMPEMTTIQYFQKFVLNACRHKHKFSDLWRASPTTPTGSGALRRVLFFTSESEKHYDAEQLAAALQSLVVQNFRREKNATFYVEVDVKVVNPDELPQASHSSRLCYLVQLLQETDVLVGFYSARYLMHSIWLRKQALLVALQPPGRVHTSPFFELLPALVGFRYAQAELSESAEASAENVAIAAGLIVKTMTAAIGA